MSKQQKILSEKKHKMVTNLLTKEFPNCEVKYNGLEGIDQKIFYKDKVTYIETKSCKKFVYSGYFIHKEVTYARKRIGFFIIDDRQYRAPYKISQHRDLLEKNGWYMFIINYKIFGIPATVIDKVIKKEKKTYLPWNKVCFLCYPNWLENLKSQVYDNNEKLTWIQFDFACKEIVRRIKEEGLLNKLNCKITNIYGIPRGGLPIATYLSHLLDLPLSLYPTRNSLLVDDISDKGKTLSIFSGKNPLVTIYYHKQSLVEPDIWIYEKKDKWIQFPWEVK